MSRLSELSKNTVLFAISNFASKLLVFLMVPLYTSVLSPEDYGVCDFVSSTNNLLLPIFTLCISEAILRYTIEDKDHSINAISIGINICIVSSILVVAITPILSIFFNIGFYVWFIPIFYLVTALYGVFSKYSRAINKVKESAIAGVIQTIITVILNVIFLIYFKWGIIGYLTAYVFGSFFSLIYLIYICDIVNIYSIDVSVKEMRNYLSYSLPLVPNSISWWLIDSASRYIIRFYISLSAIGLYAAASKVPAIINILAGIFMEAWILSVLKDYNKPENKEFISNGYSYFNISILLSSYVLILLSYPISKILIRGDFIEGWVYMPYMICSSYYGALSSFLGCIYSAEKCTSLHFKTTFIGGIVSVSIGCLLATRMGVYGVMVGVLIGYVIIWLCRLFTTKKYIDYKLSLYKEIINHSFLIVCAISVSFDYIHIAIIIFVFVISFNYSMIIEIINRLMSHIRK